MEAATFILDGRAPLRQAKAIELLNLKQGSLSVDEYQQKFIDLLPYCPYIGASFEAKYDHFLQGLNQENFDRVTVRDDSNSYEGLVNRCRQAEISVNCVMHFGKKGQCAHCGKNHPTDKCHKVAGACFHCGEIGHLKNDCAQARGAGFGSGSQTTVQYVSLCGILAFVFIDTDASHSFIIARFVKRHKLPYIALDVVIFVSTPNGQLVLAKRLVLVCPLEFEFNVLTESNCGARPPKPLVSALRACRALKSGREDYLIYEVYMSTKSVGIGYFPVVNEFSDVFPDEILGFTLVPEVEFGIELMPRTSPISRAPYRLALSEMRELKQQL
ncbi:uncharacterized protein [Henckelia pumila]|uniref:uncharacterized protein n=1 Tax=Henckelia pumila TaxID=405737 RepID=UPI003C6DFCDB